MKQPPTGSASFKKLNPHLFPRTEAHINIIPENKEAILDAVFTPLKPKPAKRIRQSSKPLTVLEREWGDELAQRGYIKIRPQKITFVLGNGVRYTPDWTCYNGAHCQLVCYECKGKHSWDDAIVKIKMAPTIYPEIVWVLVWKEDGQWKEQIVLP